MVTGMRKSLIGLGIALVSSSAFAGDHPGFDTRVAKAAADIAAQKIGDIRGTISHDQSVELVTGSVEETIDEGGTLGSRPAWKPEQDAEILPPMVSNQRFGVDQTLTGSIAKFERPSPAEPNKLVWDRYDASGLKILD